MRRSLAVLHRANGTLLLKLFIAAVFQVADGVRITAISGLRGMNDVRLPACIAACSYWFAAVPLGYLLAFRAQLGGVGIWIGLATGLMAAATGLSWRFHLRTRLAPIVR